LGRRGTTPLFDDLRRTDPSPSRGEDSFTFLNRVGTPYWGEVRRLLEEWFGRYPADDAPQLRAMFRSKLPGQHWAAWWELYLHELFKRLGYEVSIHPELPDSKGSPDFELFLDGSRLYVEATVVFSGIVSGDGDLSAPPWMLNALNDVDNGNFFVRLIEVLGAGPEQLKNREVSAPIKKWLDGLDPDQVAGDYEQGSALPRHRIAQRGWEIVCEAWPVRPDARGKSDHRVFGAGPIQSGCVDDIGQFESALKTKAGHYGRPEAPLVTAVLSNSSFMERIDIEQALFGREAVQVPVDDTVEPRLVRQRNGFWVRRDGPQNQRVSAVLSAIGLHPWNAPSVVPQIWLNPWANHPLKEEWPFPEATATDSGVISYREAEPNMYSLLSLPARWPGGEPFPRSTG
jgi:hypothetical protein